MNFDLSPEQKALQESVSNLLAAKTSVRQTLNAYEKGEGFDRGLWRDLMHMGLGGIAIPEAFGGAGLDLLDVAIVAEAIGRFAAPAPLTEHMLAAYAIMLAGDESQKRRWLSGLASGELRGAVALAEAGDLWLSSEWRMAPGARLTGEKLHVAYADGADIIVVGLQGGRFAIVEAGAAGLSMDKVDSFDPSRRLHTIAFDNTPAALTPRLDAGERFCTAALILIAADAFGGGSHCIAATAAYAKERVQFGTPIGQFQAVKHQLADMALQIEPTIGLYWYAAHAFDHEPERAPLAAALAKAHITDMYAQVARRMIELHGGVGYTWDHGAHIWLKRSVYDRAVFGAPSLHYKRAAALAGW